MEFDTPESELEFYRSLTRQGLEMVTVFSTDGTIIYEAPAITRVLGYEVAEVKGDNALDYVHPDDRAQLLGATQRLMKLSPSEDHFEQAELRFRHKDGTYRRLFSTAKRWQHGDTRGFVVQSNDITSLFELNRQLARNNELLSRTFSMSPNLLAIYSPEQDRFFEVSDSWCQTLGFEQDELLNQSAQALGIWGEETRLNSWLSQLQSSGVLRRFRMTCYAKDGEPKDFLMDAQILNMEHEDRVLLACQDVTETRKIERQLHQAQKMESLGQLTGGVAHDFNNLLGIIMGNAELLELASTNVNETRYVNQILEATKRGADLTQQLLAFSRRQRLAPRTLELNEHLSNMKTLLKTTVGDNCRIDFNLNTLPNEVELDHSQFENAILNLTLNARDAMPHGGTITFTTESVEINPPRPERGLILSEYIRLSVEDQGVGMEENIRLRATEPFFTTKEVGKGTGLGLSMVFGFVEQSGGALEIESNPGEGTVVHLYLPKAGTALVHARQPTPPAGKLHSEGIHVLLIEDNDALRDLLSHYLQEAGYLVTQNRGDEDLIDGLQDTAPIDLLVCDIVLAGKLSGPEIAQTVLRTSPHTRAIFMTGYSSRIAIGDHRILQKPFTRSAFLTAVESTLAEPSAQGSSDLSDE